MSPAIQKIILALIPKTRVAAYVIGALMAAAATVLGISQTELKQSVCEQPNIEIPKSE